MIQPNELRIGNLVMDSFDRSNPRNVTIITLDDFVAISNVCNDYYPIPLTEEWLVKCGFVQSQKDNLCVYGNKVIGVYFLGGVLRYDIATVKYVHQLQNLYFALTGQELKIEI